MCEIRFSIAFFIVLFPSAALAANLEVTQRGTLLSQSGQIDVFNLNGARFERISVLPPEWLGTRVVGSAFVRTYSAVSDTLLLTNRPGGFPDIFGALINDDTIAGKGIATDWVNRTDGAADTVVFAATELRLLSLRLGPVEYFLPADFFTGGFPEAQVFQQSDLINAFMGDWEGGYRVDNLQVSTALSPVPLPPAIAGFLFALVPLVAKSRARERLSS